MKSKVICYDKKELGSLPFWFSMKKNTTGIFIVLYLAYTSIYIVRLSLTMASPELKASGILSSSQIGLLGSIFFVVYAFGRLLTSVFGDRIKPYMLISLGLAISGMSTVFVAFFPPFVGILFFWGLSAFAQSMLWGSVLCTLSAIYPKEIARKRAAGVTSSVATGNIVGILLGIFIIERLGLRWAFIIPGIITFGFSIASFLVVYHVPASSRLMTKPQISIPGMITHPGIRSVAIPALFHGVMKDNITLWMAVFFVDRFSVQFSQFSYYVLLIPIFGLIGRLIYPTLYIFCRKEEHKVSQVAFSVCVLISFVLFLNINSAFLSLACLGVMYAAVSVINTSILSIYPTRFAEHGNIASVSGLMDFCTYLGAGVSAVLYGILIEKFGYGYMFLSWSMISFGSIFILRYAMKKKFIK